ncbi:MAG TPA: ABC transporter permease [Terriglobales bacterium]|nr:ABC transporter permease [Terriglobales bacterium]
MNTESSAVPESFDSQQVAPVVISATRPLYWSVRRELWENRSIYVAPPAVAAVFLLGFLISMFFLPSRMRAAAALGPMEQHKLIAQPYLIAAGLLMLTTLVVGVFYSLDALYGERRDRSILFWKSMPVSDLTAVISKAITPVVILPLVSFATTVVMQWIMLLVSTAVLAGSGLSVSVLWSHASLFQTWPMLFYHFLTAHGLWYAPLYAWLLLVSAWARRAPFLWAALPLVAIGAVERIAFNTSHFFTLLQERMLGGGGGGDNILTGILSMDPLMHFTPGQFLISPGLWIGLAIAVAFLAAAARLRQYREPI